MFSKFGACRGTGKGAPLTRRMPRSLSGTMTMIGWLVRLAKHPEALLVAALGVGVAALLVIMALLFAIVPRVARSGRHLKSMLHPLSTRVVS